MQMNIVIRDGLSRGAPGVTFLISQSHRVGKSIFWSLFPDIPLNFLNLCNIVIIIYDEIIITQICTWVYVLECS